MAYSSVWFFTKLPSGVVEELNNDLKDNFDKEFDSSRLLGGDLNNNIRNSLNAWIPSEHWIGGFLWNYVLKVNRENFLYDLDFIDGGSMQYTCYKEGMFYNWHTDGGITNNYKPLILDNHNNDIQETRADYVDRKVEKVRKLSFSLQLSDHDDYEGGNVEFFDENRRKFVAPRQRGSIIFFDSRTIHRVTKIRNGTRRSIVGWVVGPRWK